MLLKPMAASVRQILKAITCGHSFEAAFFLQHVHTQITRRLACGERAICAMLHCSF